MSGSSARAAERWHCMGTRRKRSDGGSENDHPLARTRRVSREQAARVSDSSERPKGRLILIGGAEDRQGEMTILKQVAARAHGGRLAVVPAATREPEEMWTMYHRIFQKLGVKDTVHVDIQNRDDAYAAEKVQLVKNAK